MRAASQGEADIHIHRGILKKIHNKNAKSGEGSINCNIFIG